MDRAWRFVERQPEKQHGTKSVRQLGRFVFMRAGCDDCPGQVRPFERAQPTGVLPGFDLQQLDCLGRPTREVQLICKEEFAVSPHSNRGLWHISEQRYGFPGKILRCN